MNEAGEAETSAPLTVRSANKDDQPEERPMFLHGLRDVLVDEGQPLIIEAPFTGNPIPSVKWTKDGEPIEPSERILLTCDGRKVRFNTALLVMITLSLLYRLAYTLIALCQATKDVMVLL